MVFGAFEAQHRQVFLLASAQAIFQTAAVMVMAVGGLAGAAIATNPQLATAPIAAMLFGTAVAMAPFAWLTMRSGRRVAFLVGAIFGVVGGLVAALGISLQSLAMLSLGTFIVGVYAGSAQFYRFAAAEVSDSAFRSTAISLVLAGGVVAAIAGPEIARLGSDLLLPTYLGSFLLLALTTATAAFVLLGLHVPPPPAEEIGAKRRPIGAIMRQPAYLVALFGAATGLGVMILAMTATPIAMMDNGHSLTETSRVIQAHVLGMYVPSFFTGALIARFGVLPIMLGGVAFLFGHIATTLTGMGFASFLSALVLLGIGWNFLYVGATTLLTDTYTPAERGAAQAANDLVIYAVGLLASLGAGAFLATLGWQTLNLVLLPWLALCAGAILWLAARPRAGAATTPRGAT
jgi:predicted MFS family arabinose efflux permease